MVNKAAISIRLGGRRPSIDDELKYARQLYGLHNWGELVKSHPWKRLKKRLDLLPDRSKEYAGQVAVLVNLRAYAAIRAAECRTDANLAEVKETIAYLEETIKDYRKYFKPAQLLPFYIRQAQALLLLGKRSHALHACNLAFTIANSCKIGQTLERGVLHLLRANIWLGLKRGADLERQELAAALLIFRGEIKKEDVARQFVAITHQALAALEKKQNRHWSARWQQWRARRFMPELDRLFGTVTPLLESGETNLVLYVAT